METSEIFGLSFNSRLSAPLPVRDAWSEKSNAHRSMKNTYMYVFLLSNFFDKYFLESRVLDLHLCHKFFPGNFVTHFSNTDCLSADCWGRYLAFFSVFSPAWAIIDFCFLDNFLSGASLDFLTGPECLELTGGGYTLHITGSHPDTNINLPSVYLFGLQRLNISINPELVWLFTWAWCLGHRYPWLRSCSWPLCSPPRHRNSRSQSWQWEMRTINRFYLRSVGCIEVHQSTTIHH